MCKVLTDTGAGTRSLTWWPSANIWDNSWYLLPELIFRYPLMFQLTGCFLMFPWPFKSLKASRCNTHVDKHLGKESQNIQSTCMYSHFFNSISESSTGIVSVWLFWTKFTFVCCKVGLFPASEIRLFFITNSSCGDIWITNLL